MSVIASPDFDKALEVAGLKSPSSNDVRKKLDFLGMSIDNALSDLGIIKDTATSEAIRLNAVKEVLRLHGLGGTNGPSIGDNNTFQLIVMSPPIRDEKDYAVIDI